MGCCQRGEENKCTLQMRAKFAATIDMILAIIGISVSGTDLQYLARDRNDESKSEDERDEAVRAIYFVSTVLVINVIKLLMGYILWKGAEQRDIKKCKTWLAVTILLWLLHIVDFSLKLAIGTYLVLSTISSSIQIVGRLLPMIFVTLFIRQMVKEQQSSYS